MSDPKPPPVESYAVIYVHDPAYGWVPQIDDAMPASLAAHLIIDIRDLTPDEIARGQAMAAAFEGTGTVGELAQGMTYEDCAAAMERLRNANLFLDEI